MVKMWGVRKGEEDQRCILALQIHVLIGLMRVLSNIHCCCA